MKHLLIFLIPCFLSCTPQQRLARLLKKHPELIAVDTVYKKDTIIVNRVYKDTVFFNTITKDTVVIKDRQLTIKYFNTGDSIYIKGECDTIKIIREVPVIVNKAEYVESPTKWYDWVFRFLCVFLAGGLFWIFFILARKVK